MQRLIEEQYIQPHQAQILPLMIMNFSFMIQKNNVSGNALERVQRVQAPADLWDITFCTR